MSLVPSTEPLTVTILGAGNIGRTLANAWAAAGHVVTLGRRDPDAPLSGDLRDDVVVTSVDAAVSAAPTVVLAVPARTLPDLFAEHADALRGRMLIDATNALTGPPNDPANVANRMDQPDLWSRHALTDTWFRAFCTLGWENYAQPRYPAGPSMLPYGGPDDADGRSVLDRLSSDLGGDPAYLGPLDGSAAALDGLARAWFLLALTRGGGRLTAFGVLH